MEPVRRCPPRSNGVRREHGREHRPPRGRPGRPGPAAGLRGTAHAGLARPPRRGRGARLGVRHAARCGRVPDDVHRASPVADLRDHVAEDRPRLGPGRLGLRRRAAGDGPPARHRVGGRPGLRRHRPRDRRRALPAGRRARRDRPRRLLRARSGRCRRAVPAPDGWRPDAGAAGRPALLGRVGHRAGHADAQLGRAVGRVGGRGDERERRPRCRRRRRRRRQGRLAAAGADRPAGRRRDCCSPSRS